MKRRRVRLYSALVDRTPVISASVSAGVLPLMEAEDLQHITVQEICVEERLLKQPHPRVGREEFKVLQASTTDE